MFYGQEDWVLWIRKIRHQDSEEWFCTSKAIAQIMIVLLYAKFRISSKLRWRSYFVRQHASNGQFGHFCRRRFVSEPNDDPVVPLERNLYSYPLDGHLRKKIKKFLVWGKMGESPQMGVPTPSLNNAVILVSVCWGHYDGRDSNTCRRCGQRCKKGDSIWKTQHHFFDQENFGCSQRASQVNHRIVTEKTGIVLEADQQKYIC